MIPIDFERLEREARRMRSDEIARLGSLVLARASFYGERLAAAALPGLEGFSETLRPLFSWNPQEANRNHGRRGILTRLSLAGRSLFSWNPRAHRTY